MDATTIANEFLRRHPVTSAERLEQVADDDLAATLTGLEPTSLVAAMDFLSGPKALAVFEACDAATRKRIIEVAPPRLAVSIVAQLEVDAHDALMADLSPADHKDIERLLSYPDDSAGRLMERSFLGAHANLSVADVLERLKSSPIRNARSVYIVTPKGQLTGRVDMQDLALAAPGDAVTAFMHPVPEAVTPETGREELVALLERSRRDSLPVVSHDGRLLGVVRYRSLFHVIEDVATADLQKMVGVSPEERALSHPGFSIRRRLPWLHINLLTAFLAASVVGLFENLIAQFTALAILLPVVAGQSGNAGAQALAVTMRGLALKEIGIRQWRSVLTKEIMVGLANGVVLAVTCGIAVYLWSGTLGLALIIGVAMVMSMLAAGISGALVPILLTRAGQDPATASSIILTTITDVAGFLSFLGTAMVLSFML